MAKINMENTKKLEHISRFKLKIAVAKTIKEGIKENERTNKENQTRINRKNKYY